MKNINFSLLLLVALIAFIAGEFTVKIGDYTTKLLYTWYDPILAVLIIALPGYLGWMAHKEHLKIGG